MTGFVVVALALQVTAAQPPIGVAVRAQTGALCVAVEGQRLTPGMTITLVRPDSPQTILRATIDAPGDCERLERATVKGPYYFARPDDRKDASDTSVWIAFVTATEVRTLDSRRIAVRLSAAYPNAQVRSCTSKEGLHLTAWAGTPLKSQRIWHQYFYLGYDVEPTCQNADVR
jgi:hypothetical protein